VGGAPAGPLLACVLQPVQLVDDDDGEQQPDEGFFPDAEDLVQVGVGQLGVLDVEAGVGHDEPVPVPASGASALCSRSDCRIEGLGALGEFLVDEQVHQPLLGCEPSRSPDAVQQCVVALRQHQGMVRSRC
jgi:hypothetical protein